MAFSEERGDAATGMRKGDLSTSEKGHNVERGLQAATAPEGSGAETRFHLGNPGGGGSV